MLTVDIKDQIAFITLNRPDKYNSFVEEMAMSLQEALSGCASPEVRCVVLTGTGKAFCAGQDLEEATAEGAKPIDRIVAEHFNPIVKQIREMEIPVLAAVNGVAAGAGANLALCCDVVVASDKASFIQAFSKIGLVPDTGGTWLLPRLVGFGKASALMMLADRITAEEAERAGMIYKVYPNDQFELAYKEMATRLASMPTKGLGLIKRALNKSLDNSLDNQLGIEKQLQSLAFATEDSKEGIAAFKEKREAKFEGK